jgi:competence protein ComEA
MFWKKLFSDYFSFTRKDRVGILAIVILVALAYLLPVFFHTQSTPVKYSLLLPADTIQSAAPDEYSNERPTFSKQGYKEALPELFFFDPNTISTEGWTKLGLRPKTIATIEKYRNKGGHFYKPEDLQKIWGLPPQFWERVKGHIRIAGKNVTINPTQSYPGSEVRNDFKKPRSIAAININEADSASFESLPGIGAKLASRIVAFRDKLGGFHSIAQIAEIYGLKDSTLQAILPFLQISGDVQKLSINKVSKDVLKDHPYFRWKLANAVVSYREQHGPFKNFEELKKITLVTDSIYRKLLPYVLIEN